jgi:hypothetical protein
MHATIRRSEAIDQTRTEELVKKAEENLLPASERAARLQGLLPDRGRQRRHQLGRVLRHGRTCRGVSRRGVQPEQTEPGAGSTPYHQPTGAKIRLTVTYALPSLSTPQTSATWGAWFRSSAEILARLRRFPCLLRCGTALGASQ